MAKRLSAPFAGIAFLWFVGVMRDRFGPHEDRFFSTAFYGSGVLFLSSSAMLLIRTRVLPLWLSLPGSPVNIPSEGLAAANPFE